MKSQVQTDGLCSIFSQNGLYILKLLKINKKKINNSIEICGKKIPKESFQGRGNSEANIQMEKGSTL